MTTNLNTNYDQALVYLNAFEENINKQIELGGVTDSMRGMYQKVAQIYALLSLVDELKKYNDRH